MLVQPAIASPSLTATTTPLIALERVTKLYGAGQAAMHALRGIDLEVTQGEFLAVMGPSGSGKSTAMNILGCLDVPTSGTYRFRQTLRATVRVSCGVLVADV